MNPRLVRRGRAVAGLALAATVFVGCGSPAATARPTAPTASAATSAAGAAASTGASPATTGSPATGAAKVNANTASEAELAAAFAAAGIPSADRWAREVAEYRPYDSDPTWAKLRQELAKYNIDPTVLEQIVATLEP